jgi:hypothetical protein
VSTPREQLIEAIDRRIDESSLRYDCPPDAREFLQALSDLGAVVLLPVTKTDVPDGVFPVYELHDTVDRVHQSLWPVSRNGARHDTVYVNALESEQS